MEKEWTNYFGERGDFVGENAGLDWKAQVALSYVPLLEDSYVGEEKWVNKLFR